MTSYVTHIYLCLIVIELCNAVSVRFKSHDNHNVTLNCDDTLLNLPYTTYKKYWILPDESILQPYHEADAKFIVGPSPGFNLTISYLVDSDSGWYRCVILWDNYIYLVHAIDVGLNVKEEDDFFEKYEKEIMYGGMALGCFFLILLIGCTSKWCCGKVKDKDENIDEEELEAREAIAKLDRAVRSFEDSSTIGRQTMNRYTSRRRGGYVRGSDTDDAVGMSRPDTDRYRRRSGYVRSGYGAGYGNSGSSVPSKRIVVERRRSERDDSVPPSYRTIEERDDSVPTGYRTIGERDECVPPGYRTIGEEEMCFQNEAFVLENGAIIPYAPSDTDTLDRFPDNYSGSSDSDIKPQDIDLR